MNVNAENNRLLILHIIISMNSGEVDQLSIWRWVPWFEKNSPDVNVKPFHDLIMKNLRDGKYLGR